MKVLRNSNQQLLNYLEELKEAGTKVTVVHNRLRATGIIARVFIGKYKLFIEVDSGTVLTTFPASLCVISRVKPVVVTAPVVEEGPYDASPFLKSLRELVGLSTAEEATV